MNPREATITAIVLSVLIYVGLSYAYTGEPFSSPDIISRAITHDKYKVEFCISDTGYLLWDAKVTKVEIAPLSIGSLDIFKEISCKLTGFVGSYELTVKKKVNGEYKEILYKKEDLFMCMGESKCFNEVFVLEGTGYYKVEIRVYHAGFVVSSFEKEYYLVDRGGVS